MKAPNEYKDAMRRRINDTNIGNSYSQFAISSHNLDERETNSIRESRQFINFILFIIAHVIINYIFTGGN
jgi:hypothetical protein